MSTFADTSGFLAVLDADDANHAAAARVWKALVLRDEAAFTTNYVVVETISLLKHGAGVAAVRRFCEGILPYVCVDWVEEALHARAVTAVIAAGRRGPSLVDCVSFETMNQRLLTTAFAFDQHLSARGVPPSARRQRVGYRMKPDGCSAVPT